MLSEKEEVLKGGNVNKIILAPESGTSKSPSEAVARNQSRHLRTSSCVHEFRYSPDRIVLKVILYDSSLEAIKRVNAMYEHINVCTWTQCRLLQRPVCDQLECPAVHFHLPVRSAKKKISHDAFLGCRWMAQLVYVSNLYEFRPDNGLAAAR